MNTGKAAAKRKSTGFHIPKEHISTTTSTTQDQRRVRVRTTDFREERAAPESTNDEASEDLRTLQAVDDIGSFSYLLGEDVPIFQDDDPTDSSIIQVTMKAKRNDNSVSPPSSVVVQCTDTLRQDFPLSAWIPFRDRYLDELLRSDGRGGPRFYERCCVCRMESVVPEYRCAEQECMGGGMMCKECTVCSHKNMPLHWIEVRDLYIYIM